MRNHIYLLFAVLAGVLSAGCNNALYFYETEKFSLTLEGKPDAAEPVSGNLGIKQRVVVITPARKSATQPVEDANLFALDSDPVKQKEAQRLVQQSAGSDAMSIVSYFDLSKDESNKLFVADTVHIKTLFVTGDAAAVLTGQEAADTLKAAQLFQNRQVAIKAQRVVKNRIRTAFLRLSDPARKDIWFDEAVRTGLIAQAPAGIDRAGKDRFFDQELDLFVQEDKPDHLGKFNDFETFINSH